MNTKRIPLPLSRPTRRLRPSRVRGSVLILVVALLVLMALIGTAWISTARVDRAATVQNTHTTTIELLVDGVVNSAVSRLASDVYENGVYRRWAGFRHVDDVHGDDYLASRIPTLLHEIAPVYFDVPTYPGGPHPSYEAGQYVRVPTGPRTGDFYVCRISHRADPAFGPSNGTYWKNLNQSYDLNAAGDPANPPVWAVTSRILPPDTKFDDISGALPSYTNRIGLIPTTFSLTTGSDPLPAFQFYHPARNGYAFVLAGDTDGDGVADASYFKLPVGRLNGLDYYAAIRVVDNNSAINVNTAMGPLNPGVAHFSSSLNLWGLIQGETNPEADQQRFMLNRARFNQDATDDFLRADFNFAGLPGEKPLTDHTNVPNDRRRDDFFHPSIEQLLYSQLGRRMANPGYWTEPGVSDWRMKPVPASDQMTLAFRGGTLMNPDAMNADTSPSAKLEQLLDQTLYYGAPNHPGTNTTMSRRSSYPVKKAVQNDWYGRNFDHAQRWNPPETQSDLATWRNRRALLTLSNPVSSGVPGRFRPAGVWENSLQYDVGDYVYYARPVSGAAEVPIQQLYVCISPVFPSNVPPGHPPAGAGFAHTRQAAAWEPRPFATIPTKVSVNAGSYGELFLAFWQVMAEDRVSSTAIPQTEAPFRDAYREARRATAPAGVYDNPYIGNRFTPPAIGVPTTPTFLADTATVPAQHPMRMFRSPLRAVPPTPGTFAATTPRVFPDHMIRLRSSLAAVNAIDMRDNDSDITYRDTTVYVTMNRGDDVNDYDELTSGGVVPARVRVYGHEKQPYITEVFAQTQTEAGGAGNLANPAGYVAVELHNPYPFAIDIRHCKIATIDRRGGTSGYPALNVIDGIRNPTLAPNLGMATSNLAAAGTSPLVIPANGYLVLENYDASATGTGALRALYRPASSGLLEAGAITPPAGAFRRNFAYVPNLHTIIDKEFTLVRPLYARHDVVPGAPTQLQGTNVRSLRYVEAPTADATYSSEAVDMAPLDSYDFTGLVNPDPTSGRARLAVTEGHAWHYMRPTGPGKQWRFVYPGRYDASQLPQVGAPDMPRQQGTWQASHAGTATWGWDTAAPNPIHQEDPWDPTTTPPGIRPVLPTLVDLPATVAIDATYPHEYAIQLQGANAQDVTTAAPAPNGASGPHAVTVDTGNQYPFGGFANDLDILDVPYIGAYRVKLPGGGGVADQILESTQFAQPDYDNVLELNSITMDAAFAEDTDPTNYYITGMAAASKPENIGRFTPSIEDLDVTASGLVDNNSGPNTTPGFIIDGERDRARDPSTTATQWVGYEIVITDGPGKGQVRTVTAFDRDKGRLEVSRGWDTKLDVTTRYILRRGTGWRDPANPLRTAGNKAWAADLLDYLTVDSPQNDHFPMADPSYGTSAGPVFPPSGVHNTDPGNFAMPSITYGRVVGGGAGSFRGTPNLVDRNTFYVNGAIQFVTGALAQSGEVQIIKAYTGNTRQIEVRDPFSAAPAAGDIFRIFGLPEDQTPTQGLVNLNTAPWPVLAALPFFPAAQDALSYEPNGAMTPSSNGRPDNTDLAMAIAEYRDGNPAAGTATGGVFRSLFDLYKVPAVYVAQLIANSAGEANDVNGDYTPPGAATDGVRFDYEEQNLLVKRVSNMVTTRSDSFTVYVLVQGWRGAGTTAPELVVQRRRAFVTDRSGLNAATKDLPIQYLYND